MSREAEMEEAFPGWEEPQKPAWEPGRKPADAGGVSDVAQGKKAGENGQHRDRVTILRRPDGAGMLASHHAAYSGDVEKLLSIIEDGAGDTLCAADKDDLWTPAHYASGNGKVEVLSALGDLCGPDSLEVPDKDGRLPSHVAAIKGERMCLLAIQAANATASLHKPDLHLRTPAHYAALNGHEECLKVLLQAPGQSFPSLAVVDAYGKTPADYAIQCRKEGCARLITSDMRFMIGTSPDDLAGPCEDWEAVGDMLEFGNLNTGSPF